eukprot:scaffold72549_cov21-Phaeocystis_antarctica.AAC.1
MVTLRTEDENIDECQTTLRFAQRAKVLMPAPVHQYQCTNADAPTPTHQHSARQSRPRSRTTRSPCLTAASWSRRL